MADPHLVHGLQPAGSSDIGGARRRDHRGAAAVRMVLDLMHNGSRRVEAERLSAPSNLDLVMIADLTGS